MNNTSINVDVCGESGISPQKMMRKKSCLLLTVILALTTLFLCGCGGSDIEGTFDKESAKKVTVFGLTSYYPDSDWKKGKNDSSFCEIKYKGDSDDEGELSYEVSVFSADQKYSDALDTLKRLRDLTDEDYKSVSIDGCDGATRLKYVTSSDKKLYGYFVNCGGVNFLLEMTCANEDYYDTKEFNKIIKATDFSKYEPPVLESISAEYDGDTKGDIMIDKNNISVKVSGVYSDGSEIEANGWTIKDPRKTKWGAKNTFDVEYEGKTAKLIIETDKNLKQVGELAYGLMKEDLTTAEFNGKKIKADDKNKSYVVSINLESKFYKELQDYWYKGIEMYPGTMSYAWDHYTDRIIKVEQALKEHFDIHGRRDIDVTVESISPKGEKKFVITNYTIKKNFYDSGDDELNEDIGGD